jgi:hypothetical protein
VPYFGRAFLMLKYTDITQNTYIQSLTIIAREKCGLLAVPCTVPVQLTLSHPAHVVGLDQNAQSAKLNQYFNTTRLHMPCTVLES